MEACEEEVKQGIKMATCDLDNEDVRFYFRAWCWQTMTHVTQTMSMLSGWRVMVVTGGATRT